MVADLQICILLPYLHMQGISAVAGSITRNLADLQDDDKGFVSIYDHPNVHISVFFKFLRLVRFI